MVLRIRFGLLVLACLALIAASTSQAQQKGQYVPGQWGLNAGVVPTPGFTYANMAINYSASSLNDSNGNHRPNVNGTYGFWVDENIVMYEPKFKILRAHLVPFISINPASGSLVADISGTNLSAAGGGSGLADTWVQPVNLAWHFSRADFNAGYAFMAPTGRYVRGRAITWDPGTGATI